MRGPLRSSIALFIVLVAASPASTAGGAGDEVWIPDSLTRWLPGLDLLHEAREDDAVAWLQAELASRPDDPCAYAFLALAYNEFEAGSDDERGAAAELVERGLALPEEAGDAPRALYCRGVLYGLRSMSGLREGRHWRAAMDGKRFRRIMLGLRDEHPAFVDTEFWIGSYEYAADVLPRYIKILKTFLFLPGGSAERGIELLEDVADRGVLERFNAYFLLQDIYRRQERGDDRRRILEAYRADFPDNPWPTIWLAWDHFESDPGNPEAAVALHRQAVEAVAAREGAGDADLLLEVQQDLAMLYQRSLDDAAAVELLVPVYERARGVEVDELAVARQLIDSWNRLGRHAEALRAYDDLARRYPGADGLAELRLAVDEFDERTGRIYASSIPALKLARQGKTDEAEAALRELLERHPDEPLIHFEIAQILFAADRLARAEGYYLAAIDGNPALPGFGALPGAGRRDRGRVRLHRPPLGVRGLPHHGDRHARPAHRRLPPRRRRLRPACRRRRGGVEVQLPHAGALAGGAGHAARAVAGTARPSLGPGQGHALARA